MDLQEKDIVRSISISFEPDGSVQLNASVAGALTDADGKVVAFKPGSIGVNRTFGDFVPSAITELTTAVIACRKEDADRLQKHLEEEAAKAKMEAEAARDRLIKEAEAAQARADELADKAKG